MRTDAVEVNLDGLNLSLNGPGGKESLGIEGNYPVNLVSEILFSNLGLMHLIAPYLPRKIRTDFVVMDQFQELIGRMYASEKKEPPSFNTPAASKAPFLVNRKKNSGAIISYSAGKDSIWNLWWAQKKFGKSNVRGVHIAGLNRSNASGEKKYAVMQSERLGFPLDIIHLRNGSKNSGYKIMRSRNMFMVGLIIPLALEFGAREIITEGFAETGPAELFTGQKANTVYFNSILRGLGLPVKVAWRDRKEIGVIKDLLENKPGWLSYVHNCFAPPCYQIFIRKTWERRAPTFPLYQSQCGSCVKCRITNIARVLYDPAMNAAKSQDIRLYLCSTQKWIREKRQKLSEMIDGSFMQAFQEACKKYDVQIGTS